MLGLLTLQAAPPTPLDRMVEAVRGHRSVLGTLRGVAFGKLVEIRFRFAAPTFVRLEGAEVGGTVLMDGTEAWCVDTARRTYRRASPSEVYAKAVAVPGYCLLLRPPGVDLRALFEGRSPATFAGERWEGRDVVDASLFVPAFSRGVVFPKTLILRLDPNSALPLGFRSERPETGPLGETYRYENVFFDRPLPERDFRFAPLPGYRDEATIPRPVAAPPPPLGTPYPRVETRPGEWVERGGIRLRVEPRVREYGGMWVFDLRTSGLDESDLRRASAMVRMGAEWRFATIATQGGRTTIVTVPQAATKTPPRSLQLRLAAKSGSEVAFVVEWPP